MKTINLYGGPGTGKSSVAAHLFALMKWKDIRCELVREYAKDLAYIGNLQEVNQIDVTYNQIKRELIVNGKVDFLITDSPVDLGLVFNGLYSGNYSKDVDSLVRSHMSKQESIDIFLIREKKFETYGRVQTEEEAIALDERILDMLCKEKESFHTIAGNKEAAETIMRMLGV